ncbi:MAG: DUF3304 domain-containing protein [Burkholderia sp.]|jgi:hypothetical protein|uniref:DUF3304 domain-containing protein n=1 Tax=Burkholderia sp. TaxID=36773 RepID=UPI00281831BE|nr:DUF3304 domain-containing protein [Burkholderia sp.]MDR0241489.1 DUF3304 domain-containing protein [Burkholderia sp.]
METSNIRCIPCTLIVTSTLLLSAAPLVHAQTGSYGPYRVVGFNHTDRGVYSFVVDEFGAGSVHARQFGGGGGTACCMEVPRSKKAWHIKVTYDLTPEEDAKNLSPEVYETDIAVPKLPNKREGYIEFHFLPERKIDAKWVEYRTDQHNPNTRSDASSATN